MSPKVVYTVLANYDGHGLAYHMVKQYRAGGHPGNSSTLLTNPNTRTISLQSFLGQASMRQARHPAAPYLLRPSSLAYVHSPAFMTRTCGKK